MAFFTYIQNNTGGSFDFNDKVTHIVVVEETTASRADARAELLGIYFDGVREGSDCACCGDRWSRAYGEGYEVPSLYGRPVEEAHLPFGDETYPPMKWRANGAEIYVYRNGVDNPEEFWK